MSGSATIQTGIERCRTPACLQTRDVRANLVYAVKISVKNDGYIKKGMYGEILFEN